MSRKGFALVELLVLAAVALVLGGLLLLFGGESRRSARLGEDLGRLRFHAWATDAYAGDRDDRYWAMDWTRPHQNSQWDDLNQSSDNFEAPADQAIDIVRRLGNDPAFPKLTNWLANHSYAHLALADHLGLSLPDERFVSTADAVRLGWQSDPANIDPMPGRLRPWAYSASFIQPLDFAVPVYWEDEFGRVQPYFYPATRHYLTFVSPGATVLPEGQRRRSEVLYPSALVQMHDTHARHHPVRLAGGTATGPLYCTYDDARIPVLMGDGSASVRRTGDANAGWNPGSPFAVPGRYFYEPDLAFEAPTLSGEDRDLTLVYYRWTRGGLRGRDFGPEVPVGLN